MAENESGMNEAVEVAQKKQSGHQERHAESAGNDRPQRARRTGKVEENVVLVGKKPTMSYVLAVVMQFSDGINEVHLKARGRNISTAVDVAEVVRNRFVQGANTGVQIGTDEIIDDNNNKINVSTIDITLKK
jgi:DNA-binding protein